MKLKSIFMAVLATASIALTGCHDDDSIKKDSEVLKPISEHITGKWSWQASYQLVDEQWAETERNGIVMTWTIRPDGTAYRSLTTPDAWTVLQAITWSTSDENNQLILDGDQTLKLFSLTDNSFEFGETPAKSNKADELLEGEYKWRWIRMNENKKNLAEQLVGKWAFQKTYEKKVNGEWVETNFAVPDNGWFKFGENGNCIQHTAKGGKEEEIELQWSIYMTTGEIRWSKDAKTSTTKVALSEDGNMLEHYYMGNRDAETGEIRDGEFKDVLVREQ